MIDGAAERTNELDRGRPRQQAMTCAPDLSHPALSEPLEKMVAAQLSGLSDLVAEREEHARADVRHHDDQQVRKDKDEEELQGVRHQRRRIRRERDSGHHRHAAGCGERREHRPPGRRGNDDGEEERPDGDPREPDPRGVPKVEALRLEQLRGGDAVAAGNFKDDGDRGSGPRRQAGMANDSRDEERDGD